MVSHVGVHRSVEAVFPPERLREELSELPGTVSVVDEASECDALVTFGYDESFLDAGLDWIHSIQAGVDRFPMAALEARNVALTNSTGINGDAVGESVVGYMLSFARRLHD